MSRLYLVATPIGNQQDITLRALEVLKSVEAIGAEDTRHSRRLLSFYGINTPLFSFRAHNEGKSAETVIKRVQEGASVAIISDAGTPLISDPGHRLVAAAHKAGIEVVSIPGPSAFVAALVASGLPTQRFHFEGFLPIKSGASTRVLEALKTYADTMDSTLIFYEAPHRIIKTLDRMISVFSAHRPACLVRELTKQFETVKLSNLGRLGSLGATG